MCSSRAVSRSVSPARSCGGCHPSTRRTLVRCSSNAPGRASGARGRRRSGMSRPLDLRRPRRPPPRPRTRRRPYPDAAPRVGFPRASATRSGGRRPASVRRLAQHATLHASISWSVDLLDPAARTVLTRLSVFESAFTLESAVAVARRAPRATRRSPRPSAALVDASLLELDDATARYRMLRIVRQFCEHRAQGTADLDAAHARHVQHVADWCTDVGNGLRGIERGPLLAEMPDVVAAMEWARRHEPARGLPHVRRPGRRSAAPSATTPTSSRSGTGSCRSTAPTATAEGWSAEWAAAVAALMAPATAQGVDVSVVAEEVRRTASPATGSASGVGWHAAPPWLRRIGATSGRSWPTPRRPRPAADEMEMSIYGGFAAYMLSMMGRGPEADDPPRRAPPPHAPSPHDVQRRHRRQRLCGRRARRPHPGRAPRRCPSRHRPCPRRPGLLDDCRGRARAGGPADSGPEHHVVRSAVVPTGDHPRAALPPDPHRPHGGAHRSARPTQPPTWPSSTGRRPRQVPVSQCHPLPSHHGRPPRIRAEWDARSRSSTPPTP